MESNPNPFPDMNPVPESVDRAFALVQRAYRFGRSIVRNTNTQAPLYMSNHYNKDHFVEAPLDPPVEPVTQLSMGFEPDFNTSAR